MRLSCNTGTNSTTGGWSMHTLTCRKVRLMSSVIKTCAVYTLQLFLCFTLSKRWSSYLICGHREPAKKAQQGLVRSLDPSACGMEPCTADGALGLQLGNCPPFPMQPTDTAKVLTDWQPGDRK